MFIITHTSKQHTTQQKVGLYNHVIISDKKRVIVTLSTNVKKILNWLCPTYFSIT